MTSSYRPIAIIPVLSKIIEEIVFDQLIVNMTVIVCSQMHSSALREDDRLRPQLSDLWGESLILLRKKDLLTSYCWTVVRHLRSLPCNHPWKAKEMWSERRCSVNSEGLPEELDTGGSRWGCQISWTVFWPRWAPGLCTCTAAYSAANERFSLDEALLYTDDATLITEGSTVGEIEGMALEDLAATVQE